MKRLFIAVLLIFVGLVLSGQVVIYNDTGELRWDATTTMNGGAPILPGDTVTYDVYIYDYNNPTIDNQDVTQLIHIGTTTETLMVVTFPERREWVVGVSGKLTDGGGTSGAASIISWSLDEEYVDIASMGGPFYYTPLVPLDPLPNPENLKDQRY